MGPMAKEEQEEDEEREEPAGDQEGREHSVPFESGTGGQEGGAAQDVEQSWWSQTSLGEEEKEEE